MSELSQATLREAFAERTLFDAKSWQLSPRAWPLSSAQVAELEAIGQACLEFHQALEGLYLRSVAGKNLLRNRPLVAPWVATYLDQGKPAWLVEHARAKRNRGAFPTVLRPDLLLTEEGFALTELDSVPGGIGLTAYLNRLYAERGPAPDAAVLGGKEEMVEAFYRSLTALRADLNHPLIALVVSEEAATYRPEMEWLAEELQRRGRRVYCLGTGDVFPLGTSLCFDVEGNPEKIDIVYRFFELFDLPNLPAVEFMRESWEAGELAIAPPLRPFQEEKLNLALFHHHLLQDYWRETLSRTAYEVLSRLIPVSWIVDPAPLPPGAVLEGPRVGGRALHDWRQLGDASQKERELILKISGFHESAWGARSVTLGSDCSKEEWREAVEEAVSVRDGSLYVLQHYKKPRRVRHPLYAQDGTVTEAEGRLRLCPYYFVEAGQARLSGALATFCPPDKKIIHGMQDAALLPCRLATV